MISNQHRDNLRHISWANEKALYQKGCYCLYYDLHTQRSELHKNSLGIYSREREREFATEFNDNFHESYIEDAVAIVHEHLKFFVPILHTIFLKPQA